MISGLSLGVAGKETTHKDAMVDFRQARQPYHLRWCRRAGAPATTFFLQNPGKTAVLAVLPLVAALLLLCLLTNLMNQSLDV